MVGWGLKKIQQRYEREIKYRFVDRWTLMKTHAVLKHSRHTTASSGNTHELRCETNTDLNSEIAGHICHRAQRNNPSKCHKIKPYFSALSEVLTLRNDISIL